MKPRRFNKRQADDAFAAHSALLQCETANPDLRDNPCWTVLRQDAFARFAFAFIPGDAVK